MDQSQTDSEQTACSSAQIVQASEVFPLLKADGCSTPFTSHIENITISGSSSAILGDQTINHYYTTVLQAGDKLIDVSSFALSREQTPTPTTTLPLNARTGQRVSADIAHSHGTTKDIDNGKSILLQRVATIREIATKGRDSCARAGEFFDDLMDQFEYLHQDATTLMRYLTGQYSDRVLAADFVAECLESLCRCASHLDQVNSEIASGRGRQKLEAKKLEKRLDKASDWLSRAKETGKADLELWLIQIGQQQSNRDMQQICDLVASNRARSDVSLMRSSSSFVESEHTLHRTRAERSQFFEHFDKSVSQRHESRLRLRLPTCITKKCINIVYARGSSRMNMELRFYNIIELYGGDAPVGQAIRDDDVCALRECLFQGSTVYDQDYYGNTLLSYALSLGKFDTAQALISYGATQSYWSEAHASRCVVFEWVLGLRVGRLQIDGIAECCQLLIGRLGMDESIVNSTYRSMMYLDQANDPVTLFPDTTFARSCGLILSTIQPLARKTLPLETRASSVLEACFIEEFMSFVGSGETVETLLRPSAKVPGAHQGVLRRLVRTTHSSEWHRWSDVVQATFKLENLPDHERPSTLLFLLEYENVVPGRNNSYHFPGRCREWLEFLASLHIDLEQYGRRESQTWALALESGLSIWDWYHVQHRIFGFNYGKTVSDWRLFTRPVSIEYELAGYFWDFIENPELFFVPGQYIDTDQDDDFATDQLETYHVWRDHFKRQGREDNAFRLRK